ncbi:hypothetical protein VTL71DRAFT_10236 [Oculimacula yallundae]|uniref:Uncharacterized protein n=1 Tax=Oculimacula yallundae TaxID=86028 RepID=A0ABR4BPG5_9HELO
MVGSLPVTRYTWFISRSFGLERYCRPTVKGKGSRGSNAKFVPRVTFTFNVRA